MQRIGRLTLTDLDYELPADLIAQQPAAVRDASRLLVVDRERRSIDDSRFVELPSLLRAGDLLVVNDTRVVPAKLSMRRASGGKVSGLFVRVIDGDEWEVLLTNTKRIRPGERLAFVPEEFGDAIELIAHEGRGRWRAKPVTDTDTETLLKRVGRTPLPPYIHRDEGDSNDDDPVRYQTLFAARSGAVAAPTAAFHFTPDTLDALEARGVERATVTLHVGPGTFAPVTADCLDDHVMHAEWYDLPPVTADAINACRRRGGRVVAIGTTTTRVLETCVTDEGIVAGSGWTEIFIQPPHAFRAVDALLTNFHLPRSTLLALVMAFADESLVRDAYQHAIAARYRFYSYGDAMLII